MLAELPVFIIIIAGCRCSLMLSCAVVLCPTSTAGYVMNDTFAKIIEEERKKRDNWCCHRFILTNVTVWFCFCAYFSMSTVL